MVSMPFFPPLSLSPLFCQDAQALPLSPLFCKDAQISELIHVSILLDPIFNAANAEIEFARRRGEIASADPTPVG